MLSSPLFLSFLLLQGGIASVAITADAPFRIVSASRREVRVDIGVIPTRAETLRRVTVLTSHGVVPATLVRTERVCEWVCGEGPEDEDGQECHFEAILRTSGRADDSVGVLAGARRLEGLSAVRLGPAKPIVDPAEWLEREPIRGTYAWRRYPDGVFLASGDTLGRDFYAPPIQLTQCTTRTAPPFTSLMCPTAELLYDGRQGVVVSFADYGTHSARPLLHFRMNGREAVLIRLGLKVEMTVAVLTKNQDGTWKLHLREADCAQIC